MQNACSVRGLRVWQGLGCHLLPSVWSVRYAMCPCREAELSREAQALRDELSRAQREASEVAQQLEDARTREQQMLEELASTQVSDLRQLGTIRLLCKLCRVQHQFGHLLLEKRLECQCLTAPQSIHTHGLGIHLSLL